VNFSLIRIVKQKRLASVILCRPEKKNALNDALIEELQSAFTLLEADDHLRVILLKAEGDVFSAGADLEYLQKLQLFSYEQNLADSQKLKNLFYQIHTNKKIVIAQVEGHAIAGGCGLATIGDFCFAVPEARFGYTEVRIGFIPAVVSVFLSRKISGKDVRELLLTGHLITAGRAEEIGLINAVIEKEKINSWVEEFALSLCRQTSTQSIASTKELLAKISSMEINEALQLAAEMNAQTRGSDDCKKGIAAFLNKEKLEW
jgi:methylglutaconyl-CoA hydratase